MRETKKNLARNRQGSSFLQFFCFSVPTWGTKSKLCIHEPLFNEIQDIFPIAKCEFTFFFFCVTDHQCTSIISERGDIFVDGFFAETISSVFFMIWLVLFIKGIMNAAKKSNNAHSGRQTQKQSKEIVLEHHANTNRVSAKDQTNEDHYRAADPCSDSLEYNSAQAANRLYKDPWEIKSKYKGD